MKASYKSSGVNITEGDKFVKAIAPLVKSTFTKGVTQGIGNFGSFFQIDFKKYKSPVLVSSVDGVGTKLKLVALLNKYDTIGEDLVNHCVNDIAVCGAVPQFFLDYYATGKLKSKTAQEVVKGLIRGCKTNGCALIGGETAEMPGVYHGDDFDLAGSITGVVEKSKIVNKKNVKRGDVLIGIASSGLHTNGYSLVRKIFDTKQKLNKRYSGLKKTLGLELLNTHRSYLELIQSSLKKFKVKSISHITGGGIEGNTKRVVPKDLKVKIDYDSWERPAIFDIIQVKGNVDEKDMRKTFNLGIGLVFIVSPKDVLAFRKFLKQKKETFYIIGNIQ
ncbi:MAG: phosphoribosylformylglycinamidine cyclo-ligase [Bacteroidetes bacterium]|nr:phosphoribosylformylglycinamidine cyclo-ligase [Bacteroidota bacterium]